MCNHAFWLRGKSNGWLVIFMLLVSTASVAQVTNASFTGTYTVVFQTPVEYSVQFNMFGQQVGFCTGATAQLPPGYFCSGRQEGQNVVTGTLISNGAGSIVAGSSLVFTTDPNAYKCSSAFAAVPSCPYFVPAGVFWSSTTSYAVGNVVDVQVSSTSKNTYQAVKASVNVSPPTHLCTNAIQPPNCSWVQVFQSATGKNKSSTSTTTGTYALQSNGSGVMKLTITNQGTPSLAMVVPSTPVGVGQEVPLVGVPVLGNETRGSGVLVRVH
ncbi:MAG TPA: hypothetical protein VFJ47_12650 [Terriglobales bacterium]|nr:hypothetical protein [Terriglobales bacterium]